MSHSYIELEQIIKSRQQQENINPDLKPKTTIDYSNIRGKTLLYYAIEMQDLQKVKQLIEEGAKTDQALEWALQAGNVCIAEYLFSKVTDCSKIPLKAAKGDCRAWFAQKIQIALDKVYPIKDIKQKIIPNFIEDRHFFSFKSFNEFEHLLRAAEIGDTSHLMATYDGSQIYEEELKKKLTLILERAASNGQLEIVKAFVENGNVSIHSSKPYTDGPLHSAILNNQIDVVRYLLEKEANINEQGNRLYTPMMLAINNKNLPLVQLLLSYNPDLNLTDVEGNTLLHLAAKLNDTNILESLLENPSTHSLLASKNIYGRRILDCIPDKNNSVKLKEILSQYQEVENEISVRNDPIRIDQDKLNLLFDYYLRSQYRDINYEILKGNCNGFSYLFNYYADQGKEDYFYDTLEKIAQWSGKEEDLCEPFPKNWPQSTYKYKNLQELLEKWIEDVFWFQQSHSLEQGKILRQDDRLKQHQIVQKSGDGLPKLIYQYTGSLEEAKIKELFHIFINMPEGTVLELGGAQHATTAYRKCEGIIYYDCNFLERIDPFTDAESFFKVMMNFKYKLIGKNPAEPYESKNGITFSIYYFSHEDKSFGLKIPINQLTFWNHTYTNKSPNQFSLFHLAYLFQDLNAFKALIDENKCDINAKDLFNTSVLELAIKLGATEITQRILQHPQLKLDIDIIKNVFLIDKPEIVRELAVQFLKSNQPKSLNDLSILLLIAIKDNDLSFVRELIENPYGIDINHSVNRILPIKCALEQKHDDIIKYFLKNPELNLFKVEEEGSLLEYIIQERQQYYPFMIENIRNINKPDEKGNTALHYALEYEQRTIIEDLLKRGAVLQAEDQLYLHALLSKSILKNDLDLFNILIPLVTPKLIDQYDMEGLNLLHLAVTHKRFYMLEQLIQKGANIDIPTKKNTDTCMHILIDQNYDLSYIKLFLDHKANLDIPNKKDKTVRTFVKDKNCNELNSLLEGYGQYYEKLNL